MPHRHFLRTGVPLPDGLTGENIYVALERVRDFFAMIQEKAGINLADITQANTFSGIVSNVFTQMLNEVSAYKKNSDQRYPDLINPSNNTGLEVKASNRPMKGGEGHNGHSGWHIVVCFFLTSEKAIEFSQVEIANLIGFEEGEKSDWKYCGSHRNANNSQRTETYTTTAVGTAKLRDGTIYLNTDYVDLSKGIMTHRHKLVCQLPIPDYSPFKTTKAAPDKDLPTQELP